MPLNEDCEESPQASPNLKDVLQGSLSRIHKTMDSAREQAADVLGRDVSRADFNRDLLASMAAQIDAWEKQKPFDLRISQLRGLHSLIAFLERGGNEHNTGYFRQPTGAGKTVLYSLIAFLLNRKTVIFVPKNILLEQTKEEMMNLGIPENQIGIVGAGSNETDKQFLIVNYASHNSKMTKDPAYTDAMNTREVIICDEAHRSLGKVTSEKRARIGSVKGRQSEKTIDEIEELELSESELAAEDEFFRRKEAEFQEKRTNILTLGFTATTELRNKSVHDHFYELIAEEKYSELVDVGILVPFKVIKASAANVYEDELDYIDAKSESEILQREDIYDKLHRALLDLKRRSKIPIYPIAYCSTQKECDNYQADAKKKGLRCAIVTSREHKDALQKAERELLAGLIDEIATVDKLTEGWNLPPVNCAIIARASQSPARIVQGAGRTSRSFSGDHYKDLHLNAFLHKTHSFVIETDWVRKMRVSEGKETNGKRGEHAERENGNGGYVSAGIKPLDFAQALAMSGENPEGIVTREDEADVAYTIQVDTREPYEGRGICTTVEFLRAHSTIPAASFFSILRENSDIAPIPHLAKGTLNVYFEDDLRRVLPFFQEQENHEPRGQTFQPQSIEDRHIANAEGIIFIETETGQKKGVITWRAAKILGIENTHGATWHLMRKYGFAPIPTLYFRGMKVNAYWEEDVLKVKELTTEVMLTLPKHPDSTAFPDEDGKVLLNVGKGDEMYWTAVGFEQFHDLPQGFILYVAKRLEISPHVLGTGQKSWKVFKEQTLQGLTTLIPKNSDRLELPDLQNTTEASWRVSMPLSDFSRSKGIPTSTLYTALISNRIKPITKSEVVDPTATVIPAVQKRAFSDLMKIEDSLRGTYYLAVASSHNLSEDAEVTTCRYKDRAQTRLYWLDDLEVTAKDIEY